MNLKELLEIAQKNHNGGEGGRGELWSRAGYVKTLKQEELGSLKIEERVSWPL